MKWEMDKTLDQQEPRTVLLQLAMYAQHLGHGNTLFCRSIKVVTIKKYIQAAATFHALFGTHSRDYRKTLETDTQFAPELTTVYADLTRWETAPKRREPFTLLMLKEHRSRVKATSPHPDSSMAALDDWFVCGTYAGFRLSEWAQEAKNSRMGSFQLDLRNEAKALCLRDVRFASSSGARFSAVDALNAPSGTQFDKCWIIFRTQKNGDNGEEKMFTRNTTAGGMCFVTSMLSIVQRFVRIRGAHDLMTPLALYNGSATCTEPSFITSADIEAMMRPLASKVYSLDPVKDKVALSKWSAHSLRVGACTILHAIGFTEPQIKFILRWQSSAFMVYLRSTRILADNQNRAFDDVMAMPHFV